MATSTRPAYSHPLDGLRAVSVGAVMAFHLGFVRGGFLGVDVFFVVSGFLITRLLVAELERTGRVSLRAFWARRLRRLVPALLVVLVAVAVGSRGWLAGWRLAGVRDDALAALLYVANWRFAWSGQSYFAQGVGPSPLRHTWSLAVEEQFYVAWPLVVVAVAWTVGRVAQVRASRRVIGAAALVGTVASAAWMVVSAGSASDLSRIYYGTETRVFALGAGAWLGTVLDPWLTGPADVGVRAARARHASAAVGPALVGIAVLVLLVAEDAAASYRYAFQLVAILTVVVVAGLVAGGGRPARLLAGAVPRWVGRRSYGIYLWSWPTQVLVAERYQLDGVALAAVVVPASVIAAALSFALVEEPVRQGRSLLPRWVRGSGRAVDRPGRVPVLAPAALSLVVLVVVVSAVGTPPEPAYLGTSDDEAVAAALAPATPPPAADVVPTPAPDPRPETSVLAARASASTAPSPSAAASPTPPGPFDPAAPLLVPAGAQGDPAAVRGRDLRVMLTGDSVGWSLGWDLDGRLDVPIELSNRAIVGCGILPAEARWVASGHDAADYVEQCRSQDEADELGLEGRPDVVLVSVGAWEVFDHELGGRTYRVATTAYARLIEDRLQARIDRYRSAGAATVVPLVACFGAEAPYLGDDRLQADRLSWVNDRLRAVASRNRGWVRLVDPAGQLCDAGGRPRTEVPSVGRLRVDGAHFEPASAAWLWNTWLAPQLAAAFARPA